MERDKSDDQRTFLEGGEFPSGPTTHSPRDRNLIEPPSFSLCQEGKWVLYHNSKYSLRNLHSLVFIFDLKLRKYIQRFVCKNLLIRKNVFFILLKVQRPFRTSYSYSFLITSSGPLPFIKSKQNKLTQYFVFLKRLRNN